MEKKIIAHGKYWVCENMDNLAPIIETGTEYLLSDDSTIRIKDNNFDDADKSKIEQITNLETATLEEKMNYARKKFSVIYKGDIVVVKRGRKYVGETKEVKGYYRYDVAGTYGHAYTEYLLFTDGTKVNINHCDTIGVDYEPYIYQGKEYFFRRYEEAFNILSIPCGGRKG